MMTDEPDKAGEAEAQGVEEIREEGSAGEMTEDLHRTAIHEAGHAVCALRLGIFFESVSVKSEGDVLGRIVSNDYYNKKNRGHAMAGVMCSLGGCVAETIQGYEIETTLDGARGDFVEVVGILRAAFKTDKECLRRQSRAYSKTSKLLGRPETWALVEKLAVALLEKETLTFEEAVNIAEFQDKTK